jgi:hypothetical protein
MPSGKEVAFFMISSSFWSVQSSSVGPWCLDGQRCQRLGTVRGYLFKLDVHCGRAVRFLQLKRLGNIMTGIVGSFLFTG